MSDMKKNVSESVLGICITAFALVVWTSGAAASESKEAQPGRVPITTVELVFGAAFAPSVAGKLSLDSTRYGQLEFGQQQQMWSGISPGLLIYFNNHFVGGFNMLLGYTGLEFWRNFGSSNGVFSSHGGSNDIPVAITMSNHGILLGGGLRFGLDVGKGFLLLTMADCQGDFVLGETTIIVYDSGSLVETTKIGDYGEPHNLTVRGGLELRFLPPVKRTPKADGTFAVAAGYSGFYDSYFEQNKWLHGFFFSMSMGVGF